jgi:glycosyltransferase involved in cell wall biosynthesis
MRQADVVMTPTQAMLDDLRRYVEVPAHKAIVNPYGVTPFAGNGATSRTTACVSPGPQEPPIQLLYVSLYSEYKNLGTLLKALPILNRNGSGRFLIKTTVVPTWGGAPPSATRETEIALSRRSDIAPWVLFLEPRDLPHALDLYRNADIFVFPSVIESFGHPMVEAMAHGLPVVAADTPVNREVLGPAAVYFSPFEPEDLARQVGRLIQDKELCTKLCAAGRERATTRFRWKDHVTRLMEAAKAGLFVGLALLQVSSALFMDQWFVR